MTSIKAVIVPAKTVFIGLLFVVLSGCAAKQLGRDSCATQLEIAWKELDIAKTEGFAGSVSYTKAVGLLSAAKFQQSIERYDSCLDKVSRARVYIAEANQGQ